MQKYSYVGGTSPSIGYHHYYWNFVVIKTRAQKRKERKSRDFSREKISRFTEANNEN
jgi:hypothetical protein